MQAVAQTTSFPGALVTDSGIETDPEKIQAIGEWPTPTSVTEVRSFVGLCSYRMKVSTKDFAAIAGPLHALTGKKCPAFAGLDACQTAFEELRRRLVDSTYRGDATERRAVQIEHRRFK